ncbi:MAG: aminopeptidase P family protein [Anaerolineae bacterium]|nr:aminopeptidase P family protein [Anaerolineae bacterium]
MISKQQNIGRRQKELAAVMEKDGLAAIALVPGPSLRYLTGLGFMLTERPIIGVFTPSGPATMIVPDLERMKLDEAEFGLNAFNYGENPETWPGIFAEALGNIALTSGEIGVEELSIRLLELRILEDALPGITIKEADEIPATLRRRKDETELALMREAAKIAQGALESTTATLKIGMSEKEAAAELTSQLFRQGSGVELPFEPIVSTGLNSANPHALPSDRKLAEGDLLVIDFGATVDGYFSDITRTFAVGEVEEEFAKIHMIVQEANAAARAAVRPGTTCGEVDKAARDVIEHAGYGDYFIHRTGHGLGLEIHEEPYMRAGNDMVLEPGMTFTIEPGIYLPGRGGVRIEDDVAVIEDGIESFSDLPREMISIG